MLVGLWFGVFVVFGGWFGSVRSGSLWCWLFRFGGGPVGQVTSLCGGPCVAVGLPVGCGP